MGSRRGITTTDWGFVWMMCAFVFAPCVLSVLMYLYDIYIAQKMVVVQCGGRDDDDDDGADKRSPTPT